MRVAVGLDGKVKYPVCRAKLQDSWKASAMSHLLKEVEQTDLVQYGLIPEFVGRFPVICSLQVCFPILALPADTALHVCFMKSLILMIPQFGLAC